MTDFDKMILRACKLVEITDIKEITVGMNYSTGEKSITVDLGYNKKADEDFANIDSPEFVSDIWTSQNKKTVFMWRVKRYDSEIFDIPIIIRKLEYMDIDDFIITYGCEPDDIIVGEKKVNKTEHAA